MGQAQGTIPVHAAIETQAVPPVALLPAGRQRRTRAAVDAAVGVGHPRMPLDHIARGLARIALKGVRTAKVVDMGGVPVVMTKALPEGVHAMMLADRIVAVRTATGRVVVTVARDELPCAAVLPDAVDAAGTDASSHLGLLDAATAYIGA